MAAQDEDGPRFAALRKLVDEFGLTIGDTDSSANEDVTEYFDGYLPVERFVAVTRGGDFTYLYADYDSLHEAGLKAVENVDDCIYAESPLYVIDLDTGERWVPRWESLQWRRVKS